jgi:type I restriction enzyme S subunit
VSFTIERLGNLCQQVRGVSYSKESVFSQPTAGCTPIIRANNITDDGLQFHDLVYVRDFCVASVQMLRPGDIVIAASSGSIDVVGKAAPVLLPTNASFGAFCKVVRPGRAIAPSYLAHFFRTVGYRRTISSLAAGSNINNLRNEHLDDLQIPLPSLEEQKGIAAILDKADAMRRKRQASLKLLDQFLRSTFLDIFGDSFTNTKKWKTVPLPELSVHFSDGPFGSNLKTSHYTRTGIRVIRLQNIGIGEFEDEDKVYIAEDHYNSLPRHHCQPGDVIVGTLGDPNLRACVIPNHIQKSLNKADCVQIRPNKRVATAEYICHLLNTPGALALSGGLILGQTRSRISMGRLKTLRVPLPDLPTQKEFSKIVVFARQLKAKLTNHLSLTEDLFVSLQQGIFDNRP